MEFFGQVVCIYNNRVLPLIPRLHGKIVGIHKNGMVDVKYTDGQLVRQVDPALVAR